MAPLPSCARRCATLSVPHVAAYPPGRVHRAVPPNYPLTDRLQFDILRSGPGWRGPNEIRSIETARVHHAHQRRGSSLAACGWSAAAGDTDYRMAARGTTSASGSLGSVPPGLERLGLYRRTQCSRRTEGFGPI